MTTRKSMVSPGTTSPATSFRHHSNSDWNLELNAMAAIESVSLYDPSMNVSVELSIRSVVAAASMTCVDGDVFTTDDTELTSVHAPAFRRH